MQNKDMQINPEQINSMPWSLSGLALVTMIPLMIVTMPNNHGHPT
jgi:hypothetical protein